MQSKLPVRIKKKLGEKKCCCPKFLQIMIENPSDAYCTLCVKKENSSQELEKEYRSRSTQTDSRESWPESDKKSVSEIKQILVSINATLEAILSTLHDKKEQLYNILQEEATECKKTRGFFSKNRIEKYKKKNSQIIRKSCYGWPDVSRLYYGQPPWFRSYIQQLAFDLAENDSNFILYPRNDNKRPISCPNINYFQQLGKFLGKGKTLGVAMYRNPAFTLIGHGDMEDVRVVDDQDLNEEMTRKEIGVKTKEIQPDSKIFTEN